MKKLFILALFCFNSIVYAGPSHCDQFVPFGYPTSTERTDSTQLCKLAYYVLYDNKLKTPIYSAEWLLPENLNGTNPRVAAFKPDPALPVALQSTISDYKIGGFDKGHMSPLEDMRKDSAAMLESFYLSNIVPQNPALNRGLWKSVEDHTRKLATSLKGVYVVTGSVFPKTSPVLIGKGVGVPTYVYKVIIDKAHNVGIGYLVPNVDPQSTSYKKYAVAIKDIESVTGVNFTPTLDATQSAFKAVIAKSLQ